MKQFIAKQKGSLLLVTLIGLVVLSVMGFAFLSRTNTDVRASGDSMKKMDVSETAQSALNRVALNLQKMVQKYRDIHLLHETPVDLTKCRPGEKSGDPDICEPIPLADPTVAGTYDRVQFIADCKSVNGSADLSNCKDGCDIDDACEWVADRYELSKDLDNIEEGFKIAVVKVEVAEDNSRTRDLTDNFRIPHKDVETYSNLNSGRRIYKFNVTSKSPTEYSSTTYESRIAVYNVPLFQWLKLHEDVLTMLPGGRNDQRGRIHSNTAIRAGTLGGPISFFPMNFTEGNLSLTTSGSIFHIFNYNNGKSSWGYVDLSATKDSKSVRVVTDDMGTPAITDDVYARFNDHLVTPSFAVDAKGYPTAPDTDCGDVSADCWLDDQSATSGYKYYGMKVNAKHPDFDGRISDGTSDVHPLWFKEIKDYNDDNPTQKLSISDIIQPIDINSNGLTDSALSSSIGMSEVKKVYLADIRVMIQNDGSLISVDASNDEITSGPFSITELMSRGIVKRDISGADDFYMPPAGKEAKIVKLDISGLDSAMTARPDLYGDVDHIYIGSVNGAQGTGNWQYPTPDCDSAESSKGFSPICFDENGNDCLASCATGTIGSFDAVMVVNGEELPDKLTISSNTMVAVQGHYNKTDQKSTAIYSDSTLFLSKDWDPSTWYDLIKNPTGTSGWNVDGAKGPPKGSSTTYNLAYMSGRELPPIEAWSGRINRDMSEAILWESQQYPPRWGSADDEGIHNWLYQAWSYFYWGPTWINKQSTLYATDPPPDSEWMCSVWIISIKEVEGPFL